MNSVLFSILTALCEYIFGMFSNKYTNAQFSTETREEVSSDGSEVLVLITRISLKPEKSVKSEKVEKPAKVEKVDKVEKLVKVEKVEKPAKVEKKVVKIERKAEKSVEKKDEEITKEESWIEVKSKRSKDEIAMKEGFGKYQNLIINFSFDFDKDLHEQINTLIGYSQSAQSFNKKFGNLSLLGFKAILHSIASGYQYNEGFYKRILKYFISRVSEIYRNSLSGWYVDEKQIDFGLIVKSCKPTDPIKIEGFKKACQFFLSHTQGMPGWTKESRKDLGSWFRGL